VFTDLRLKHRNQKLWIDAECLAIAFPLQTQLRDDGKKHRSKFSPPDRDTVKELEKTVDGIRVVRVRQVDVWLGPEQVAQDGGSFGKLADRDLVETVWKVDETIAFVVENYDFRLAPRLGSVIIHYGKGWGCWL
jgi:hypothetical protein